MEKSSISVSATSATNVKKIYRIKVMPQQAIRDQCLAVARGEAQSEEILPILWFPSEDALRTVTNNNDHPLYALVMEALASDSPEGGSFSDEELKILKRLEPGALEPIEDMEKQLLLYRAAPDRLAQLNKAQELARNAIPGNVSLADDLIAERRAENEKDSKEESCNPDTQNTIKKEFAPSLTNLLKIRTKVNRKGQDASVVAHPCPLCFNPMVLDTRDLPHMYKGVATVLTNVTGEFCTRCNTVISLGNDYDIHIRAFIDRVNAGKHDEMLDDQIFRIGSIFYTGSGKQWRCTDIGSRTIIAIEIEPGREDDWYNGPPYAVVEHVFDEYDLGGLFATREESLF